MEDAIKEWLFDPVVGKIIAALLVVLVVVVLVRYTQRALGRYIENSQRRYRRLSRSPAQFPGASWLLAAICSLALGPSCSSAGGTKLIAVTADHPVDAAVSEMPHVEPHIVGHPEDAAYLVAGSIVVSADPDGPWHCAAFVSTDAGQTWTRHDFSMERCIDPWALVTSTGKVFVAGIEIKRDLPADERFRLLLFRSDDAGQTWDSPLDLGRAHDHELMLEEPGGELLLVSRRADRARAGQPRHRVGVLRITGDGRDYTEVNQVPISNLAMNPTGLVRLADGSLVISVLDYQRNVDGFDALGVLNNPRAWAIRSPDGGSSFSEALFLSEDCGPTEGFAGYPALALDESQGPFRDRLYHLCVRADFDGMSLSTSADGGETWTDPQRIDQTPGDAPAHVRTPMLAVNREGVVAAAWYDRRNDPARRCQDLYLSYSTDGGVTFQAPVRVSTETSCPQSEGNGRVANSWPMGGDYGSLAAAADGVFHVLWADSRSGRFQLHHAALKVDTARPDLSNER